ncbi:MerR family transcriptional regulator [Marinitenerispora sediminis]|uniref:MerR family transcriptional regulator n=1 Tax=Marinitenerispora sediminis TaxID=1931232 RepID=A0A368T0R0_9ACTN|nr:MerR family transcriptional regulator [Marinitenerispora sediminis]RCV49992.1 MerR family transcriptional regulator [Marinitenerispora sediminis]RCV51296.1 MerR family transcriptional regulator [Marinitenerispora sediminis]RCV53209.1 MerR family transcriptional regulator [Marinitenerispora sediminis]
MRIGELARRTGASERALRYYEEQGLLRPARRPSGYREFTEADAATVRRIRTLLAAGLGTAVIAEVLPCMADADGQLAPACAELTSELIKERDRISEEVGELLAARAILDGIIAAPVPAAPGGEGTAPAPRPAEDCAAAV